MFDPESGADAGPPPELRDSPLHDVHVAAGAAFTEFAGWRMPVRYSSDLAEHAAVRAAAGLFDLSHMAEIVVLGPEAPDALDYALAGPLSAVAVGRAKYSFLLARDGGILDDLVVYRTAEDRFVVVANAANRAVVAAELLDRCAPFDAVVEDESDDVAMLALQGPRSEEILREVDGFDVDSLESLKNYAATSGDFRGHGVFVARTGYTGEDGFELYLDPAAAPELWTALLETGAGSGLVPVGLAARDSLRLEAGMPLYGHELSIATQPVQAGLGRAVAVDKEAFVGRDGILAGPAADARVLVGLVGEGRRAARAGHPVVDADGAVVGEVTSGILSPTLGHPIALALVDPAVASGDTPLAVDVRGTALPVTRTAIPFYRRPAVDRPTSRGAAS